MTEAVFVYTRQRSPLRWLSTGWVSALLIALALTLYSYLTPFIPSARWLELIKLPAGLVATALSVPLFVLTPRLHFERARDRIIWHASRFLGVPIVAYVLWQGLLIGAPAVGHHLAVSTESVRTFTVKATASHYYRYSLKLGRCNGKLYLDSAVRFLDLHACGIPESDWRRAEVGDQIELHGTGSWFGLKYTAVSALW